MALVAGARARRFSCSATSLIYWRNADMDLMVIYNALVLNDGKPQQLLRSHRPIITILVAEARGFSCCMHSGLLDALVAVGDSAGIRCRQPSMPP